MRVTIVIPFYKGLNLIKNAITKLDNQKTSFEYDILIINSSEPSYIEQLLNLSKRIILKLKDGCQSNNRLPCKAKIVLPI